MTGYARQDISNNISNGSVINADDLDLEFNAVEAAFNGSTGHTHDGTTGNGAPINVLGPNQDVLITASVLRPKTDNTVDLGTSTLEFKDLYIDGVANIDSLVADTADINGGTVDGVTIATSDITVGAGKTLDISAGTLTLADNQISGDKVEGGTINATTINTLTSTTGNITNVNATNVDTTNLEVTNLKAKDGTSAGSIANTTGVVTLASSVLTTSDINGGTIDGTTIDTSDITVGAGKTLNVSAGTLTLANDQISGDKVEGGTINAITITTLGSTTGNITNVNATTVDTTNLEVTNLKAKDGTSAGAIADTTGVVTLASSVLTTTDINGGTIDGATIATSDITVGAGKTLNVSAGTLTLANDQISGDKVEGGTINATTITTLTSTTGNITNVNATTVDTTNLEVTNLKAKDGTSAGSIANTTGIVTLASSVLTTTDINGGTIDGVAIGGASAAAITGTVITFTDTVIATAANSQIKKSDTSGTLSLTAGTNTSNGAGLTAYGSTSALPNTLVVEGDSIVFRDVVGTIPRLTVGSTGTIVAGDLIVADKIVHSADTNTALRFPAADTVTVETNGSERLRIDSNGNVGIGTSNPTQVLDVNANSIRVRTAKTPASATATGSQGEIAWDADYIYICTATNIWKRVAISTW